MLAGYELIRRFLDPQPLTNLGWVPASLAVVLGVIGPRAGFPLADPIGCADRSRRQGHAAARSLPAGP